MTMPPITRLFDLAKLSEAGADVVVEADDEQRANLARWAGIDAVTGFTANIALTRPAQNRFGYRAELRADIVQACVVTLEPVRSQLKAEVWRALHLSKTEPAKSAAHETSAEADDSSEEIKSTRYDLAAPLLEEFALAIDPYPRAPGVVYRELSEDDPSAGPFERLRALKKGS